MLYILALIFGYCSTIEVRKEWRDLQPYEKQTFFKAVQLLKITPSIRNPKVSVHDEFTFIHYTHTKNFHKNPQFLPFHRVFTKKYEDSLNTAYQNFLARNPTQKQFRNIRINMPYWNFLRDGANIPASPVLNEFGGFGTQQGGFCVKNGPFSTFVVKYSAQGQRCLRRKYENGVITGYLRKDFTMPKVMNFIKTWGAKSKQYNEFRYYLEWSLHTLPHVVLGGGQFNPTGDMGQLDFSPNDPLFYLIHSMIDKLWFEYQKVESANLYKYDGKRYEGLKWNKGYGRQTNIMDRVQPFTEYRVLDVMNTANVCYVYSRPWFPALKVKPSPPSLINTNVIPADSAVLVKPYNVQVQNKLQKMNIAFSTQTRPQQNMPAQTVKTADNGAHPQQQPQPQQKQSTGNQQQIQQQQQQQVPTAPVLNATTDLLPVAPILSKRSYKKKCDHLLVGITTENSNDFLNNNHKPVERPNVIPNGFGNLQKVNEERKQYGYMGGRYSKTMEALSAYMNCISQ